MAKNQGDHEDGKKTRATVRVVPGVFQGDRKGRPYNTTGEPCGRPGDGAGNTSQIRQGGFFIVAGLNKLDYNGAIFKDQWVKERIMAPDFQR